MLTKELDFLDVLSVASFVIGLQNLELNITQNDLADQTKEIDAKAEEKVNRALEEIHQHLQEQDTKIEELLRRTENENHKENVGNDNGRS